MLKKGLLVAERAVVTLRTDWHYLDKEQARNGNDRKKTKRESATVRRRKAVRVQKR